MDSNSNTNSEETPIACGLGDYVAIGEPASIDAAGKPASGVAADDAKQAAAPTGMNSTPPVVIGRKSSIAWTGFFPPVTHENGSKTTTCMHCPQTYLCGSRIYGTSNMLGYFRTFLKNIANMHAPSKQKKNTIIYNKCYYSVYWLIF